MTSSFFEDLTDVYESMIDWPKRLAHEGAFYRRWLERYAVRSVADVACGTGRHAAMFHSWGLRVEASDLSAGMIDRARARFGEPEGLRWSVRGFEQPAPGPVDAVVCVGNSLPLAPDLATIQQAIRAMFSAVRPGGLAIVQVLNLWRLADGPLVWQKCLQTTPPLGEMLLLKGVHRSGVKGYVNLVIAAPSGELRHCESVPLLGVEAEALRQMAQSAGADEVNFFGGYQDQPYEREASVDLVMVAVRGAG
jgi:SAM-dependent methyltransferase